ncbi:MAG: PH domain-containing protein [Tetrasphaera sp.]
MSAAPDERPFRPRRGRQVAGAGIAVALVLFGVVALLLPGPASGGNWTALDKAMVWGLGWGVALLLVRYSRIEAVPRAGGLFVRNLFLSRTIPWAEIEDLRFGGGEPWVALELFDGEHVALMAIQRADGLYAADEAARLAALVDLRQQGSREPGFGESTGPSEPA